MVRIHPALVGVALVLTACASDDAEACVANDVGRVCAISDGGRTTFEGEGLQPGSTVSVGDPSAESPLIYTVAADGTFEPGAQGHLTAILGVTLTFRVAALDAAGDPLTGELVVET
jgi:hypothetical protein